MDGNETAVPGPAVQIAEDTRERMILAVAGMVFNGGYAPAEILGYLENGFPQEILDGVGRVGERAQLSEYVDVLLHVLQTPGPSA